MNENEVAVLRAVAGDAMVSIDDALMRITQAGVTDADFSDPEARALFAAMLSTLRAGQPLDVVALSSAVGSYAPRKLVADVVMNFELGRAASRLVPLREAGKRRRLCEELRGLVGLATNEQTSYAEVHSEALRVIQQLASPTNAARTLEGTLPALIDRLQAVQTGARESTLPTGIDVLDYAIGGLQPTLTIVGALPGVGKSALLVAIARNLAARGMPVGVLSLEDEREWLTERILAEAADVPLFVLGNKPLTNAQMGRITETFDGVGAILKNIVVDDSLAMTPAEVVASARSMVARGCRAIIVDHLGEIRLNRSERHDLDVAEALQDLRGIAKTYRVPVVVACHMRRREGLDINAVPKLTDFAFSAAIERCARVALGLFRHKTDSPDEVAMGVEVLKQTKGPANFNFRLNVGRLSGTVSQTPVTPAMQQKFGGWRDE